MTKSIISSVPYVQAKHVGGHQRPKFVVLRLTNTASVSGVAMAIALGYNKRSSGDRLSHHYVVDESTYYQCVPANRVAITYGAELKGALSVNICARAVRFEDLWYMPGQNAVFDTAAQLVAKICTEYKIPVRYFDPETALKPFQKGGIVPQVTGAWPQNGFLQRVNDHKR